MGIQKPPIKNKIMAAPARRASAPKRETGGFRGFTTFEGAENKAMEDRMKIAATFNKNKTHQNPKHDTMVVSGFTQQSTASFKEVTPTPQPTVQKREKINYNIIELNPIINNHKPQSIMGSIKNFFKVK